MDGKNRQNRTLNLMSTEDENGQRSPAEEVSEGQLAVGEAGQTVGFVTKKIRASNPKHRGEVARARIAGERLFKRAEKKLSELLKDVPDEYLDRALRRLGEQLNATKKIWDLNAKRLID